MAIIGIDTSGKIGQLPIYIASIKIKNPQIIDELRESLVKKKTVFGTRRKFDVKYLNKTDVENLIYSISYSTSVVVSTVFSDLIHMYTTSKDMVDRNDMILVDKDYDYERMKLLCSAIKILFRKIDNKNLEVEIDISYNDSIAIADIMADLCRLGKVECRRIKTDELIGVLNEL